MSKHISYGKKPSIRLAGVLRFALVAFLVAVQIGIIFFLVHILQDWAFFLYIAIQVIALIDVFIIVGKRQNTSFTMAWVLLILLLPVTGHVLYVFWGRRNKHRRMRHALARTGVFLEKDPEIYRELGEAHPRRKRFAGYLGRMGFPVYKRTSCTYYPLGDDQFRGMLEDIKQAKNFVFLEYFIIAEGSLLEEYCEVLIQKASEGVEVRVMYDDLGSLLTLPDGFETRLRGHGIQVLRFNPIQYSISRLYINYRNHQKICVIDGEFAYTGGTNLADEYANYYAKHGHWKDTAIRLEGDAVWSLTVFFLQMWEAQTREEQCFEAYRPPKVGADAPGFYQPFIDGPMNNPENPAESMYRSIIYNAREYVYASTPYLIIDNSMIDALCTAALGGTDVRILTPRKWDHWYVHMVTQSNYSQLMQAGVRIYEYTPGYIHAKTIISDDDHCITGTFNMDYRSFYLHYENGVYICGAPVIEEIKADFLETFAKSNEIDPILWGKRPFVIKVLQGFFRIFAIFF